MTRLQVAHSTTSRLVTALNSFGLRLLQEESARSQEQNLFLSPVSIFLALAMAENGSDQGCNPPSPGAVASRE